MKLPKILVTGGTGYIGSHTTIELIKSGHEVVVIDNLSNSDRQVLERIAKITGKTPAFYKVDLKDKNALDKVVSENQDITGVIHFAAFKSVEESVGAPLMYYDNNIGGLTNLLEILLKYRIYNLVFSSSCSIYGQPDKMPVTEETPSKDIQSPYARTKKIGEEIISDVVAATPLRAVILRYFNPAGAHESAEIGDLSLDKTRTFITALINTVIGKQQIMEVYGNDYPTKDGTCIRDFIHIQDLAEAHVKALSIMNESNDEYAIFNIGSGSGFTLLEVIGAMESITGKEVPKTMAKRRPGDVYEIYADISKVKEQLGWQPKRGLDQILTTGLQWERKCLEESMAGKTE